MLRLKLYRLKFKRKTNSDKNSFIFKPKICFHRLLEENLKLFGLEGQKDSQIWQDYVKFVDGIIYNSLLVTVGVR